MTALSLLFPASGSALGGTPDAFAFAAAASRATLTMRASASRISATISDTFCHRSSGVADKPFIMAAATCLSTVGKIVNKGMGGLLMC